MPILFGVVLIDLIGFGIVIPILPFLSPQLGADKVDIALIIVTYAACAGIFGPFWGKLSDRRGRKPVIMICLAGASLSYVMLGLATELWMIFVARAFAGVMAGNFGVASAMMADVTSPENRARGMGLIGAAFGLGMVLGPLIGGLLAGDSGSFTLPCIFAGLMSVLAIIAAALTLPESLSPEKQVANRAHQKSLDRESTLQVLKKSGNRLFVFQYVVHNAGVSSATYLFPLWVADILGWTAREVGMVFGVQGVIMVVMQGGALGALVKLLGEWRVLLFAICFFLSGMLLAVFAWSMPTMLASMFIGMTGATLCTPLLNTLVTHRTPASYRGRIMGTTAAASSWGRVFGPAFTGFNLAWFGYSAAWAVCALIAACYLLWAFYERALEKRHPSILRRT
ncbi:MFS transporter [Halieaceae bacterium IMCC8485]|jgi:MFS family permease|uniref:MFS transporter n=1 Tax=Candidatus Seongchinamella marina TaxID=2518990 RepID=A0ABT3SVB8_9GAMM|nr:MFS transporter [Candidatus Seongchinamella marina]MCX2973932.1 MFS transporter [Candidatus Seongchinamella marina]